MTLQLSDLQASTLTAVQPPLPVSRRGFLFPRPCAYSNTQLWHGLDSILNQLFGMLLIKQLSCLVPSFSPWKRHLVGCKGKRTPAHNKPRWCHNHYAMIWLFELFLVIQRKPQNSIGPRSRFFSHLAQVFFLFFFVLQLSSRKLHKLTL